MGCKSESISKNNTLYSYLVKLINSYRRVSIYSSFVIAIRKLDIIFKTLNYAKVKSEKMLETSGFYRRI